MVELMVSYFWREMVHALPDQRLPKPSSLCTMYHAKLDVAALTFRSESNRRYHWSRQSAPLSNNAASHLPIEPITITRGTDERAFR